MPRRMFGVIALVGVLGAARADDQAQRPPDEPREAESGELGPASHSGPRLLEEGPHDPYLPPPATRLPLRGAGPNSFTRGAFTSVQVNVDEFGQNIFGDAANEPSIAVNPTDPGNIVIGWRQFDNVESNFRQAGHGYSLDAGVSWTFPGVIEPGVFRSDPVLEAAADGSIYFLSLKMDFTCDMFVSTNDGRTWPNKYAARGGDKQWFTFDRTVGGVGPIYQTWGEFTRSFDAGVTWSAPSSVPSFPRWGTLTVDVQRRLFIVGTTGAGGGLFVVRSVNAWNPAQTPAFGAPVTVNIGGTMSGFNSSSPNPGGLVGQAWIDTDRSNGPRRGHLYVLASVMRTGNNAADVMFSRSTDGGATWSAPVRVNNDATGNGAWQWFGTMGVAPNGRIDAVWNDTRHSGQANLSELYYASSSDGGATWTGNVPLSPMWNSWIGWPDQNKIGDYYDIASDNFGADLAYAATFNGEQDVYYVRIGESDCNGNGVADSADLIAGTSSDCNANDVADECELNDCNGNDRPDECDIADGISDDLDGDGHPDECAVLRVDANAPAGGDGTSWASAFRDVQDALDRVAVVPGLIHEIWVAEGEYRPDRGSGARSATFRLRNGTALLGGFGGSETAANERDPAVHPTVLSGDLLGDDEPGFVHIADNSTHVVDASGTDASAVLDGFIVTRGNAPLSPNNLGAGVLCSGGSPRITRCAFIANSAALGGAVYVNGGGAPLMTNCVFAGNRAGSGGGAIYATGASPAVVNGVFTGNAAVNGGAVSSNSGSAAYLSCSFAGNTASDRGGGIRSAGGGRIINCALWGNTDGSGDPATAQIDIISGTHDIHHCAVQDLPAALNGSGNIDDDPLFADADGADGVIGTADDDLSLADGSPCVNAGDAAALPSDTADVDGDGNTIEALPIDAAGGPRVVGSGVDIGAFERQSISGGACCVPAAAGGEAACASVADAGQCAALGFVCDVFDYFPAGFAGCFGDADGNNVVNPGDRGAISANIAESSPALICVHDMDGNGVINAGDRGFVSANIGQCAMPPDYQNGSGLNGGSPDTRFAAPVFLGAGTMCGGCP